jgi:hypothetical protein
MSVHGPSDASRPFCGVDRGSQGGDRGSQGGAYRGSQGGDRGSQGGAGDRGCQGGAAPSSASVAAGDVQLLAVGGVGEDPPYCA